jgi:hypothetical protein
MNEQIHTTPIAGQSTQMRRSVWSFGTCSCVLLDPEDG